MFNAEYLTTAEAADYLGVSRQYLEAARYRGDGPAVTRVGRLCRYRKSALQAWMMRNEQPNSMKEA
jgi:excisionase family DNA binding protein